MRSARSIPGPSTNYVINITGNINLDFELLAFNLPLGSTVTINGGNFTLNGLPATSNLYTVNGENDMDPYFNTNNSGASNLTIGQNELSEVMW